MYEILCGDIGGTNANLCLATLPLPKKNSTASYEIFLKEKKRTSTQNQSDFNALIVNYLKETESQTEIACFAVAGPVKSQRVKMTNTSLIIDVKEILAKTPLKKVLLINDFEALGYATNVLLPEEIKQINGSSTPQSEKKRVKAILGAGTGLGKATLLYDLKIEAYYPLPSEGGHADLPLQNEAELFLIKELSHPTYEDLLSGRGLEWIYQKLQKTQYPEEPPYLRAQDISKNRKTNPCCEKVFEWFVTFYARCARNFALDLLAEGGIFLGGGITAANSDVIEKKFVEEFTKHPLYHEMLKNIPISLITNYDVSLKGAAFAFFAQQGGF